MTRFVHTADWQLGMTRHFLGAEAQARFSAARIDAIRTIGALAVAERCSFVVVSGDVFETNHVERPVVVRALDAMAASPTVTFYLLPGNHDPLDAASEFRSSTFATHCPPNVVVLDEAGIVPVEPGVELLAAPWSSKRPLEDLVASVIDAAVEYGVEGAVDGVETPAGTVRIAVGHGATDVLSPDSSSPALIGVAALEERLEAGHVHYVALGDRHSTTSVGSTGRIWYAGAPEPTDYVEVDAGNALVVEIDATGVTVKPHRVGAWRFVREEFDLANTADCEAVGTFLAGLPQKDRTIVKLALVGQLSLADKAVLDEILAHHADLLAALETWDLRSELVVLPDGDDFERFGLSGFAREALDDLRGLAQGPEPEAQVARDALGLLYRLGSVPA
ncbi:MAG TPA: metallophosphoesterase [Acidimicrobiales bacterium]